MLHLIAALFLAIQAVEPSPIPAARKATTVAVIPIRGPIDAITVASLKQRLTAAEDAGAARIGHRT